MNISSLLRYILTLQTSSLQSPDRNRLDHNSHIEFILLCVATGIVGLGIFFEWPEVKEDLQEWWASRPGKRPSWMVGPPAIRRLVPVWSLIGFLLVSGGVAAEGVFETLVGMNDTQIRRMDESSLAADELQIVRLQKDNLILQKRAGDAATSARNAASDALIAETDAGNAKTLAAGARKEADTFEQDIKSAKEQAATADRNLAQALREATQAQAELDRIRSPRIISNEGSLIAALTPFKGTEYTLSVFADDESIDLGKEVARLLDASGWVMKQPTGMVLNQTYLNIFGDGKTIVPACINTGFSVDVKAKESLGALNSLLPQLRPRNLQAAAALLSAMSADISPADERNVKPGLLDPKPGDPGPLQICVGKKP